MSEEIPDPSMIDSDDAEILSHEGVHPPTRLGSKGRIGKFEIIAPLGHGAMGHVFSAREPVTGTLVAVKILRSEYVENTRVVQTFLREARHMYQLSHPSILKVLEVSGPDEGPFLVMPLLPEGSLHDRLEKTGAIPEPEALHIMIQVADGLVHAHSKGLIHRDLKPANILLDEGGRVKISDFGLVRSYMGDSLVDASRSSLEGTPAYMSPHVAAGKAEDTRCDIYALGAVLYEMLCGKPPYTGRSSSVILQAVLSGPPDSLASLNPRISKAMVKVVECCMARELRDRYASMSDVLEDLKRLESRQAPRLTTNPRNINGTLIKAFLLALFLPVAGIGTWYFLNPQPAEKTSTGRLIQNQQDKRTSEDYLRAIELDPGNVQAREFYVRHLIDIQHWRPARHEAQQWLDVDPDNAEAKGLLDLISQKLDQGELEQNPRSRLPPPKMERNPPPPRDPPRGPRENGPRPPRP